MIYVGAMLFLVFAATLIDTLCRLLFGRPKLPRCPICSGETSAHGTILICKPCDRIVGEFR